MINCIQKVGQPDSPQTVKKETSIKEFSAGRGGGALARDPEQKASRL